MVLSVSRRTDIPNYYSEWFLNRIREGWLYVRNPMNARQISKITLSPDVVDCIVFWTKNPEPMLGHLGALDAYPFYFQFTLTGYGSDLEPHVPHKKNHMIPVFRELSGKIGRERVIWRYDPIIFTEKYTPAYHLKAFAQIAEGLRGCTRQCVISFVDLYVKNRAGMGALHPFSLQERELSAFAGGLARIAGAHGIRVAACAEAADLSSCGIGKSCCIDQALIERLAGCRLHAAKDKNQRKECGCMESVEVGTYNTCKNGCIYCYANDTPARVRLSCQLYDAGAPLLCGEVTGNDKITERKMKSLKEGQMSLWDQRCYD